MSTTDGYVHEARFYLELLIRKNTRLEREVASLKRGREAYREAGARLLCVARNGHDELDTCRAQMDREASIIQEQQDLKAREEEKEVSDV
jgi:hypothetical protein